MSTNHQSQLEIQKQAREQQTKFVYYIIALCVASIGFSVHQTVGQKLNCSHSILGVAIISWVASIFCGFQFLQVVMKGLIANNDYFNLIQGNVPGVPSSKSVDEVAKKSMIEKIEKYTSRSTRNFIWQQYWFYSGLITFLGWHLKQMI